MFIIVVAIILFIFFSLVMIWGFSSDNAAPIKIKRKVHTHMDEDELKRVTKKTMKKYAKAIKNLSER